MNQIVEPLVCEKARNSRACASSGMPRAGITDFDAHCDVGGGFAVLGGAYANFTMSVNLMELLMRFV